MTSQKDLKRLVRSRMQKTGESYTTARLQLLRKRATSSKTAPERAVRPQPLDVSKAGMSDEAVRAKTGKTWAEYDGIEPH